MRRPAPRRVFVLSCALLGAWLAFAASAVRADPDTIRRVLEPKLRAHIDDVRALPVGGLWEVVVGTHIMYTDAKASFVAGGPVLEVATDRDLTRAAIDRILRVDVAALPLDDAVVIVRGQGRRHLYVFEDPNCPHCKRLEAELDALDDVTIHAFVFPVLGDDSRAKSQAIWCSADRAAARSAAFEGKPLTPPPADCATPIERNLALGDKLHIESTPTIVFADGSRLNGPAGRAQLESMLAARIPAPGPVAQ